MWPLGPCRFFGVTFVLALEVGAARADEGALAWASDAMSLVPIDVAGLDPLERTALAHCGTAEARLQYAARVVVARKLGGLPMPELDAISFAQRIAGEPHPWPRAWAASARQLPEESTMRKLDGWLSESREPRKRRCGVASGVGAGDMRVLAVVVVDALADLPPLPTRVRAGQWIGIEATRRGQARGGAR